MRNVLIISLLLTLASSALAQRAVTVNTVSVDEFDQYLVKIQHSRDREAAHSITGITLKERASSSDLARWQAEFKGEKARQALVAVCDMAEFIAPPSSVIANEPAPNAPAQREILTRSVNYVKQTLARLPNFLAVRTTTRFAITKLEQLDRLDEVSRMNQLSAWPPTQVALGDKDGQTLLYAGQWQAAVAYRDGNEISQSQIGDNRHRPSLGLETKGEFGPILVTVLGDALRGSIRWSRWEHGANGQLAVFQYDVPQSASHYRVWNPVNGSDEIPAYRGEFAVDPGSGAIYRIDLTAKGTESSVTEVSRISLEYGPVEIGGETYVCPLHGVAYSQPRQLDAKGNPTHEQVVDGPSYLNDATFSQYHLFRSEVRILTGDGQH